MFLVINIVDFVVNLAKKVACDKVDAMSNAERYRIVHARATTTGFGKSVIAANKLPKQNI